MKARLNIVLGLMGLAGVAWGAPREPSPPEIFPVNASVVSRNSKVWVFTSGAFVKVFDPQGVEVAMTSTGPVMTPPAPVAPVALVSATGKVGQVQSVVTVTSADPQSFFVVLEEDQTWESFSIVTASSLGTARVFGLPAGETRLKLVRVDAAGNASEPTEIVASVPADRACSIAPVFPLSLLALTLLRRRRLSSSRAPATRANAGR